MNLDAILDFAKEANNLHLNLNNVIHVAGTNGKGSTVAFLRSILEASGYSVNVFTSPHLVQENERIRIKGKLISNEYNAELSKQLLNYPSSKKLSIFETFMAKALLAFNQHMADYVILETGLGGRLDATNIISNPLVEVITPIDLDHQHILGNTLALIAKEKAGIIKNNSLCVSAYQSKEVEPVFKQVCNAKNTELILGGSNWQLTGNQLTFKQVEYQLNNLGLLGSHQLHNAALAIVALLAAKVKNISTATINKGLQTVNWFARLQQVGSSLYNYQFNAADKIILDGAHNPAGIKVLVEYILSQQNEYDICLIMGMLKTKDLTSSLALLKEIPVYKFMAVNLPADFDSFSAVEISSSARSAGIKNNSHFETVKDAIASLYNEQTNKPKLIIICGSLYLLGNVLADNNLLPE